jgi:hypothetical protein
MKTSYENGDDIALIIQDDTMVHLSSLNDFDEIVKHHKIKNLGSRAFPFLLRKLSEGKDGERNQ